MYSIDKNALMKAYDGKLAVVDADSRPVPGPTASFSPYKFPGLRPAPEAAKAGRLRYGRWDYEKVLDEPDSCVTR